MRFNGGVQLVLYMLAVQNFFRKGNLIALRDLALRRTAERVDAQMQRYRADKAISAVWPTRDRVLVCINSSPLAPRLVRAGRRVASGISAPWVVLYVETPAELRRSEVDRDSMTQALRLAEQLGAETVTLAGENVAEEILALARQRNISRLIVGRPNRPRWRELLFGSTVDTLVRQSGEIDLHIISGDDVELAPRMLNYTPTSDWHGYGSAAAVVASVTALSALLRWLFPDFAEANILMAYLLAVIGIARWGGRGPSIMASVLSVLTFDFFFVPPFLDFAVSDAQYVLTLVLMLAAALGVSTLTYRLRQQAEAARQRERRTAALYAMSRELANVRGYEALLRATVRHVGETFESQVVVLLPGASRHLQPWGSVAGWWGSELDQRMVYAPDPKEQGVAQWVFDHSQVAGRGTATLPSSQAIYLPLNGARGVVGVLGVRPQQARFSFAPEQMHLLETFANQVALALERARLTEETEQATIVIETERLRSSLLSSVSHDLRTPLATITGAASSLLEQALPPTTARELTQSIYDEADRLNRLVSNLLEMTRLESGAVQVKKEWQPLDEVIGTALARTERQLAQHPVAVSLPADLLAPIDGVLIEQVLINLLENAARYTPPGSPISIRAFAKNDDLVAMSGIKQVVIEVADSGPGIDPGDEAKIFEKFYRVANTNSGHGAGLGLAIAEGITRAHGGHISVANKPDGGAVFRLVLPIEGQPPVIEGLADIEAVGVAAAEKYPSFNNDNIAL